MKNTNKVDPYLLITDDYDGDIHFDFYPDLDVVSNTILQLSKYRFWNLKYRVIYMPDCEEILNTATGVFSDKFTKEHFDAISEQSSK